MNYSDERRSRLSTRCVAALLGICVAALAAAACQEAGERSRPEGGLPAGTLLYRLTSDPLTFGGTLVAMSLDDGQRRTLAADVGSYQVEGDMASDGKRVVFVKYGPETTRQYGPYVPWLLLIDLATGVTSTIGVGTDPAVGPEGQLAYCATDSQSGDSRVVITTLDNPGDVKEISGPYRNCPSLGWSEDGHLAFVGLSTEAEGEMALYVYSTASGTMQEMALPEVRGAGKPSWSVDGTAVVFSSRNGVVLVDTETGDVSLSGIDADSDPAFSPVQPDMVAVAEQTSYPEYALTVYRGTEAVGTLLAQRLEAFAWSPDGAWLAAASYEYSPVSLDPVALEPVTEVVLWNWRTGETRTIIEKGQAMHPALLWVP